VREDDVIAQIETDKVTFDIKYNQKTPGIVKAILCGEGDSVTVGQAFATVDESAEAAEAPSPAEVPAQAPAAPAAAPTAAPAPPKPAAAPQQPAAAAPPKPPPKVCGWAGQSNENVAREELGIW
jgi:pyruvate/2-oxoglutarate dehydrogenase complex dihydrolipoamide acyltransferase (E2) component